MTTFTKQIGFSLSTLVFIYLFYALYFFEGSFSEYLSFIPNIPAISWIFCALTFIICLLAGLPIRLNVSVYNWWRKRRNIPVILIILGLIFIGLSLYPPLLKRIEIVNGNLTSIKLEANTILTLLGSFLVPFAILHIYPRQQNLN